jgi:glycosyltransferase involved in cell wall biosynthesis
MSEIGPFRQRIDPLPTGLARPLWSVMIPTYNCASYLRETLGSVLAQDPGPDEMQIEVVDDDSADDPEDVVEELGRGRVEFFRQPRNTGHVHNLSTCIQRSRGQIVHVLHGDDAVREGFYRTMEPHLAERLDVGAAFCRYISMDADGNWQSIGKLEAGGRGILDDWLGRIALGQRLQTPCMVVRRSVYERLGGFDSRLTHSEDWEMWTRIAASFPVSYEPEPLALYRVHGRSSSGRSRKVAENVVDLRRAIEINREVLGERADQISDRALEITATTAIRRAARMVRSGDDDAARAQVREALRTRRTLAVLERFGLFCAIWAHQRLRRGKTDR